jgi:phosphodiesterase/alkaline phosphatase D-like protein
MLQQVEQYYLGRYCEHFSDPDFAQGLAVLPYIFVWDDHDIFDGW